MKDKLLYIEGIRGVACFMVVLSHLALVFYPGLHEHDLIIHGWERVIYDSPLPFFYSGTAAVYIFFVLSGYVLTFGIMKNKDILASISMMTIRRYFRLAPPVVASCILAYVALNFIGSDTSALSAWAQSYGKFEPTFFGAIYSGLVETFFRGGSNYNPVLWTMKIELIGSFIVFYYCAVSSKVNRKFVVALLFSLCISLLPISQIEKYSYLCFIFGAYISGVDIRLPLKMALPFLIVGAYFGGVHYGSSAYSMVIGFVSFSVLGEMINAYYLFCAFSGVLVVMSIISNESLSRLFSGKIVVYSGKVSFSVYLIHMPIIYLISPFIFNSFLNELGYFYASLTSSFLTVFVIYMASNAFYKAFDFQSIKLSKAAFTSMRPIV
ncbi:acyltransferase family protein [Dryocola clanedunensis]